MNHQDEFFEGDEVLSPITERRLTSPRAPDQSPRDLIEEQDFFDEVNSQLESPRPLLNPRKSSEYSLKLRPEIIPPEDETQLFFKRKVVPDQTNIKELIEKPKYPHVTEKVEQFDEFKPLRRINQGHTPGIDPVEREDLVRKKYTAIEKITNELMLIYDIQVQNYIDQFEEDADKETVVLAEYPVEELEKYQSKIEKKKLKKYNTEQLQYQDMLCNLQILKDESKDQLIHKEGVLKEQLIRNEALSKKKTLLKHSALSEAFSKSEQTLSNYLLDARTQIQTKYKDMTLNDKFLRHNLAGRDSLQEKSVSWTESPQIIGIGISSIRCVKDKLPKGRYAILCTIYERLGGKIIDLHRRSSRKWRRVTTPRVHSGEYHLNNLVFHESLLILTPSRSKISPAMNLVFELFLMKSKEYVQDQVVGWGAFPLINSDFELNQGKFKIPLLFGAVDKEITKYNGIEEKYKENLDNWLANLYFEIQKKDILANPYSVQLIFDKDFEQPEIEDTSTKKDTTIPKSTEEFSIFQASDVVDKKNELIDNILHMESDEEEQKSLIDPTKNDLQMDFATRDTYLQYTYHIPKSLESSTHVGNKLKYILDEVFADLGFINGFNVESFLSCVILLIAIWIRAYLHCFGSYLFLKIFGIPVDSFDPLFYGVDLAFSPIDIGDIIGVMFFGQLFNLLVFGVLILLTYGFQRVFQESTKWGQNLKEINFNVQTSYQYENMNFYLRTQLIAIVNRKIVLGIDEENQERNLLII